MMLYVPIRWVGKKTRSALLLGLLGLPGAGVLAAAQSVQSPAPIERRTPSTHPGGGQTGAGERRVPRGEHLAQWMDQHSTLTPQQQQQALQHEPGFQELPRTTQQRMMDRLAQLDAMGPKQRQRVLARTEAMERLDPQQRAEVRGVMGQLGALPTADRHAVASTFRALRELPPEQRVQAYASGRYGPPLSDAQRSVLFNLLRVEPMLPPPAPAAPPVPVQTFR